LRNRRNDILKANALARNIFSLTKAHKQLKLNNVFASQRDGVQPLPLRWMDVVGAQERKPFQGRFECSAYHGALSPV
jgi:hypothetical protein